MLDEFVKRIPKSEPDLKVGSLQIWVSGYAYENQKGQGDLAYLRTPSLLIAGNAVVFSESSDTPVFDFKIFLNDLVAMYENITVAHVVEFQSSESEFKINLTNNDLGHIKVRIQYYSWNHDGTFDFEEMIDQSYLPKIINDLKSIVTKEY